MFARRAADEARPCWERGWRFSPWPAPPSLEPDDRSPSPQDRFRHRDERLVALDRGGTLVTRLTGGTPLDAGAVLLMLGSLEQRRRFAELFEKAA